MRSTPAMRARIRELMTDPQDDYDRAVECVLNDFEALEAALQKIVEGHPEFLAHHLQAIARNALEPTP